MIVGCAANDKCYHPISLQPLAEGACIDYYLNLLVGGCWGAREHRGLEAK